MATAPVASYAGDDFRPVYQPSLDVPVTADKIEIDGNLDDPGWRMAGRAEHFAEHYPGDQTEPPVNTVALITYDYDNVYVAFVCYDDPALVRASMCDRDALYADDNVGFFFDTYGEAAWAYELNVNPYGVQADAIYSISGGEDDSYDLVWKSAGQMTDSGWQVEMSIPFSSLRFPDRKVQTWRADFWRNRPRESREQYSWAAYDRDEPCWPCQWGTLDGIADVSPGAGLELLPSVIGYQAGFLDNRLSIDTITHDTSISREFDNGKIKGELSLNGKYVITSNMTVEATYNPDFSQVEADAAQIDVNTTYALNYPERRPFFQEGSDLFRTYVYGFYSRNINDPQFATKFTGRFSRTSVGYLAAYDEHSPLVMPFDEFSVTVPDIGKTYSNIMRLRQVFGEESHVGILVTDRRRDGGGSGTLLSMDARVRMFQNYQLRFQIVGSHTQEPDDSMITFARDSLLHRRRFDYGKHTIGFNGESFWGHGAYASFVRNARHLSFSIGYSDLSPSFRTDMGLETKNDMREFDFYSQYMFYPKSTILDRLAPQLILGRVWNYKKQKRDEWVVAELYAQLKAQTEISLAYLRSWEWYRQKNFPNITRYTIGLNSDFSEVVGAGFEVVWGQIIARGPAVMGNEVFVESWASIKPTDRLRIEPTFDYNQSRNRATGELLFKGFITRVRTHYQFTRELFMRLVVQYNDFAEQWSVDPLLTYRLNPFSLFYVGSTHVYDNLYSYTDHVNTWQLSRRQFFVKLQYLFQI